MPSLSVRLTSFPSGLTTQLLARCGPIFPLSSKASSESYIWAKTSQDSVVVVRWGSSESLSPSRAQTKVPSAARAPKAASGTAAPARTPRTSVGDPTGPARFRCTNDLHHARNLPGKLKTETASRINSRFRANRGSKMSSRNRTVNNTFALVCFWKVCIALRDSLFFFRSTRISAAGSGQRRPGRRPPGSGRRKHFPTFVAGRFARSRCNPT